MTTELTTKLNKGLKEFSKGLGMISRSLNREDSWSGYLLDILNGEKGHGIVQLKYADTFFMSLDEEVAELENFVEAFTGETAVVTEEDLKGNSLETLVNGFTLAFLGLRRVFEVSGEDNQLRLKLENFNSKLSEPYQPLNTLGVTLFYQNFTDFRYEFLKAINKKREFTEGDVIDYCNEFFEIDQAGNEGGVVYEVSDNFKRTGIVDNNFKWNVYGVECILVKLSQRSE